MEWNEDSRQHAPVADRMPSMRSCLMKGNVSGGAHGVGAEGFWVCPPFNNFIRETAVWSVAPEFCTIACGPPEGARVEYRHYYVFD